MYTYEYIYVYYLIAKGGEVFIYNYYNLQHKIKAILSWNGELLVEGHVPIN